MFGIGRWRLDFPEGLRVGDLNLRHSIWWKVRVLVREREWVGYRGVNENEVDGSCYKE